MLFKKKKMKLIDRMAADHQILFYLTIIELANHPDVCEWNNFTIMQR